MLVTQIAKRAARCSGPIQHCGRSRRRRVKDRKNSLDSEVNCNAMPRNTAINCQFLKDVEIYVETFRDSREISQKIRGDKQSLNLESGRDLLYDSVKKDYKAIIKRNTPSRGIGGSRGGSEREGNACAFFTPLIYSREVA